jgi:hypothetical protein
MTRVIEDRWQERRGTAADLASVNEIPLDGERILETDTGKEKIGDGVTNYNDLAYTGAAGAGTLRGLNDQTGTSYTVAATDAGYDIRCTNASAISVNIDTQANVPVASNFWALVSQGGAGKVTVTALTGVTLRSPNGATTTAQYDGRGIERITDDEWRVW